jgi:hypothetical protein
VERDNVTMQLQSDTGRSGDAGHAIDEIILNDAAVELAGALLLANAYMMRVGPRNAEAASKDGRGAVYDATMAAIELQRIVAEFEYKYPGASGWQAAQRAIAEVFGATWAQMTLSWILRLENAPCDQLEPGTPSLVRWGLGLPIMGDLLPALDALSQLGEAANEHGEATRARVEAVRDAITGALARGVKPEWLQGVLRARQEINAQFGG